MKKLMRFYDKITRDRWEIGFVEGGVDAVMGNVSLKINWVKHNYKDRWFADPFVLDVTDSEIRLLCWQKSFGIVVRKDASQN